MLLQFMMRGQIEAEIPPGSTLTVYTGQRKLIL
jgi:hypothetical protein